MVGRLPLLWIPLMWINLLVSLDYWAVLLIIIQLAGRTYCLKCIPTYNLERGLFPLFLLPFMNGGSSCFISFIYLLLLYILSDFSNCGQFPLNVYTLLPCELSLTLNCGRLLSAHTICILILSFRDKCWSN